MEIFILVIFCALVMAISIFLYLVTTEENKVKKQKDLVHKENRISMRNVIENLIMSKTEEHLQALFATHKKVSYRDQYGNWFFENWDQECEYFLISTIGLDRLIDNKSDQSFDYFLEFFRDIIDEKILAA